MSKIGWGIVLKGHDFDLGDWKDALKPPYDPWVEETKVGLVLRALRFDQATAPEQVNDLAESVLDLLNGALAISHRAKEVENDGIVELMEDGSARRHVFAKPLGLEMRVKAGAAAVVIGPDGKSKPDPEPVRSLPQRWLKITDADGYLADALIYYSRGDDWFDIFKALECLFARFGGEVKFKAREWVDKGKVDRLRQTANNQRHARLKNKEVRNPMERREARSVLGALISGAFKAVEEDNLKDGAGPE